MFIYIPAPSAYLQSNFFTAHDLSHHWWQAFWSCPGRLHPAGKLPPNFFTNSENLFCAVSYISSLRFRFWWHLFSQTSEVVFLLRSVKSFEKLFYQANLDVGKYFYWSILRWIRFGTKPRWICTNESTERHNKLLNHSQRSLPTKGSFAVALGKSGNLAQVTCGLSCTFRLEFHFLSFLHVMWEQHLRFWRFPSWWPECSTLKV